MKKKMAADSPEFARAVHYGGADLGVTLKGGQAFFRVWAPTARRMDLLLYRTGHEQESPEVIPMRKSRSGTWAADAETGPSRLYYTYRVWHSHRPPAEAVDPYARAAGVNGRRGMILDLRETNPTGWNADRRPYFGEPTEAVLYELHVRDFTIHASSGARHPGLYLGLAERGTRGPGGGRTGLDHLRELGVTHIHLLPVADYASVDESKRKKTYNWGYDPQNYNVPEGGYATDPFDGRVRIREFKQMVMAMHRAGLRVVLDVVFNHTFSASDSNLNILVPGYYYRQDEQGGFSNGSGCGNETASERFMMRKFMVDSLVYWAREYHVDGFRFDLMGLHDLVTMRRIRAALDRLDRTILLYGEGWTGGASPLPEARRAMKTNVRKLPRIAAFNDTIRDAIKGPVMEHGRGGFVQGEEGREEAIKAGVVAATKHPEVVWPDDHLWNGPWAEEPIRCITYNSCHDNHTLWDKLGLTTPGCALSDRIRMNKLAAAITLTSQGIVFLHAGEEFLRTKKGVENSYNQPDSINALDWRRKKQFAGVVEYYRGLMALRKAHPALRMKSAGLIRRNLRFLPMPESRMVGFRISGREAGDPAEELVVIYNASKAPQSVALPGIGWRVLVDERQAGARPGHRLRGFLCTVPARSAMVLGRGLQ
mgnify:CR=1 FL=1